MDKFMCHGKKERRRIIIIIIRRRNGAKTISLQTLFGRLKYGRKVSRIVIRYGQYGRKAS
jgi:hypothetical protein